jgi:DeoR family suf operon transcriptional repressor
MESTKERVLQLLRQRGEATVGTLAEALGVGQGAVRRHLDHLQVEGLADVRAERHGVGRPSYVFYLTEEGEERAPAGYSRLLSRLYHGLASLPEQHVQGRDGRQVLSSVVEMAAEQVAHEHGPEVAASSLESRIDKTSTVLRDEGILDGWTKEADGYHMTNTACPYRKAAETSHGPCELDRRTIELLVDAPVRQVSRLVDGTPVCEYVVAAHDKNDTASEPEK